MTNKFKLYNTLTHKKELFKSIKPGVVKIYTCGPTVYDFAHIGNWRTFIVEDILKRVLQFIGYKTEHIMNITDVGHLTDDADMGEDKIEQKAKQEKKTAREIARFYEKKFFEDMEKLAIEKPDKAPRATDYIKEMIGLIKILEKNGYTYQTDDGIYFDTSKLDQFDPFGVIDETGLEEGKRVKKSEQKLNKTDFALWKFSPNPPAGGQKRQMEWPSPWNVGFPGWHIECSAISQKFLGKVFDIHCGGVDHIPIHHTNEISQSMGAYGKNPAKFWCHSEFLLTDEEKMAKSAGNFLTLDFLEEKGFSPLDFRYLVLSNHYRSKMHFTFQELEKARNTRLNLLKKLQNPAPKAHLLQRRMRLGRTPLAENYKTEIENAFCDDLNTPRALDLLHKYDEPKLWLEFDQILGLRLLENKKAKLTGEQAKLIGQRKKYRAEKNWQKADEIRQKLLEQGIELEDKGEETKVYRLS